MVKKQLEMAKNREAAIWGKCNFAVLSLCERF